MKDSDISLTRVTNKKQLRQFVTFPWKVYENDPFWVPPMIRSRMAKLSPETGQFYRQGEAVPMLALRDGKVVGTVVPWINHRANKFRNENAVNFGFFETLPEYEIAETMLSGVIEWAKEKDATVVRGPLYFSPQDSPGVLVEGFDSLPGPLTGHTPPWYSTFIEQFGFQKHRDALAYKVDLSGLNNDINNLPPKLLNVARAVQKRYRVKVRTLRMNDWDNELKAAFYIFNEALGYQREGVPMDEVEFLKLSSDLKKIIDPGLIHVAEVDERPIGIHVAFPNVNQLLKALNGRLFPFNWIKLLRREKYITDVSTKILGVLEAYRNKGVDALLYYKFAGELLKRGHTWVDYSLVAEENRMANRIMQRMGGTVYQICRTYKMDI
ncbi:MAG: hypothetical protein V2J62_04850 [candidate division KSB1 bacterium]|jgi:GNAT superfamily N-acetyltransferase|nr:hypothetical protein [candidate division KSB1 bacterium]